MHLNIKFFIIARARFIKYGLFFDIIFLIFLNTYLLRGRRRILLEHRAYSFITEFILNYRH